MCVSVYVHDFPACLQKSKKTAVPLLEQRAVNLREMICARAHSSVFCRHENCIREKRQHAHHPCRDRRVKVECCTTFAPSQSNILIKAFVCSEQPASNGIKNVNTLPSQCQYVHLPIMQCKPYQQEYVSTAGFSWICVTTTDRGAHISI